MITISTLVNVIFILIIGGLIFWLLWWLLNYVKPPEPFLKVGNIILAILAVFFIISVLLSLIGYNIIKFN